MRALSTIAVLFLAISVSGQTPPDFTGHWRQQTNSKTQRLLEVEQKGQNLRVKTVVTNSDGIRELEVKYALKPQLLRKQQERRLPLNHFPLECGIGSGTW